MLSPHGITASAFRMKFFKLLPFVALSAIMLTGCERQFVSPIDPIHPPSTNTRYAAQKALSDLADTAAERKFVDLANAASDLSETLAIDDSTSVEPIFSKIAKLAGAATILEHAFSEAGCKIELQGFAHASMDAVRAYTIRDAIQMEQALQNLAHAVSATEMQLRQLPVENVFMPFAFGYGPAIDTTWNEFFHTLGSNDPLYVPGLILIQYDETIRPIKESRAAVTDFLSQKGYSVKVEGWSRFVGFGKNKWFHLKDYSTQVQVEEVTGYFESIDLGADVDPLLIMGELIDIPGVTLVQPAVFEAPVDPVPPSESYYIIRRVAAKYNEAWCRNNFDVIDNILIEETGLDFFDYTFVRKLADITAEELPDTVESIQMNQFSFRWIAEIFLMIYSWNPERTIDETIDRFREYIRTWGVGISHLKFDHYYQTTDYWKQLIKDHLNN